MKFAVLAATTLPLVADAASAPQTFILDGIWGYERRHPPQRVDDILAAVERRRA